jgi:hypothetical protein
MTRTWWQLSFVDSGRPPGRQWIGGINTEAASIHDAITWTHMSGLNPGGEIAFIGITSDVGLDAHYLDRLITDREEWKHQPIPSDARPVRMPYPAVNGVPLPIEVRPLDAEEPPGQQ